VQAVPFVMFKLFAQKFEKAVVHFVYTSEETCALANQEKHGKSTKKSTEVILWRGTRIVDCSDLIILISFQLSDD
jgi:hypothetical protein